MSDRISCPECGFPNKPDAMFCELCEAPLNARAKQILEKKKKLQTNPFKQIPGLPVIGNRIDFKEIISKNNRKTFLLILFFIIFFTAFGAAIGYINGNIKIGVIPRDCSTRKTCLERTLLLVEYIISPYLSMLPSPSTRPFI